MDIKKCDFGYHFVEEMADVELCRILLAEAGVVGYREPLSICHDKEARWEKRLEQHVNLDVFEDGDK